MGVLQEAQTDHFSQERRSITFKKAEFAWKNFGIYNEILSRVRKIAKSDY
jgi:hypothetical protein